MEQTLLATRVRIPPLSRSRLHRSRLIDALESGVVEYNLTHMSAPAGYGKTTLLTQWVTSTDYDVAWLSLSTDIHSVEVFFRYLVMAWETVKPDVGGTQLGLLANSSTLDVKRALPIFINVADSIPDALVFVLDDYHLLDELAIHETLTFLIDNLPTKVHVIISERGTSALPTARFRAKNMMHELRAEDLKFLPHETRDFTNDLMHLNLSQDSLSTLQQQSEGWISAIHLASLSLQGNKSIAAKIISGDQRFIADYLYEDVLTHLDNATQQFLLKTSILNEFCPSLCNAITQWQNAHEMLTKIEAKNLFLITLDNNRGWFRYHQLFRECLEEYLNHEYPDDVAELHRRATQWYLEHDLPEEAFQHALSAVDSHMMNQIFERYFATKLQGGELQVLRRWLESIPDEWILEHPTIGLAQIGLMLFTGQFERAVQGLEVIEQEAFGHKEAHWQVAKARVTAFRCFIACRQNELALAENLADEALRNLPEDDLNFRHDIYGALGDTYRKSGRWQDAQNAYLKVLDFKYAPVFRVQSVHVYGALADLSLRQGQLHPAYQYWQKALELIQHPENRGTYPLPVIGWVYIRLGELMYEWDKRDEAEQYLSQGLERAELGGDIRALIAGYLIAGRLKLAEHELDAASGYLEKARPHVASAKFAHWISQFERLQLELWLAQDRLRAAVDWSDNMLADVAFTERPESEIAQLTIARVLIARGDKPAIKRSLSLLERLVQTAEDESRAGIMIEGLALRSIAYWQQGQRVEALIHLERALRLAEPEDYIRLFVDMGLPMARLLQEAQTRDVMPDYVAKLLGAFASDFELSPQQVLPEPLTSREHDVLRLMMAGLTNPEIAEELVIAAGTVKKHAANIYGKLGVSNRTEAAKKARELDLLNLD